MLNLVSLSSSCKLLHLPANRTLCNISDKVPSIGSHWPDRISEKLFVKLEKCLSINRENVIYLRRYVSSNISFLKSLWEEVPLRLIQLRLYDECVKGRGLEKRILVCIKAKHECTHAQEIVVHMQALTSDVANLTYTVKMDYIRYSTSCLNVSISFVN